jgi:hypothetical protein
MHIVFETCIGSATARARWACSIPTSGSRCCKTTTPALRYCRSKINTKQKNHKEKQKKKERKSGKDEETFRTSGLLLKVFLKHVDLMSSRLECLVLVLVLVFSFLLLLFFFFFLQVPFEAQHWIMVDKPDEVNASVATWLEGKQKATKAKN